MNRTIKSILLIIGIALTAYGIYTLVIPETQISIGEIDLIKVQDNTNSYITIGIGLVAIVLSLINPKK
ncbi:MAG: hypothetical protein GW772_08850 [Flavobacteriia bacterium]|nr:hypothetical protein [Flavobacteriia bacterium]OIP45520.1 MAG: hypothetical protein AUK46_11780 [Flavobacteriaceae bacterium CG2_30_31_66]PIV96772.1 MAG: hypothetical protein COW43_06390 [Flavobacteriaceae bacterium CG17_big_fil_post_rev_8_21_14_2_50_31_13]PIX12970.1 MAG: hypothetical protein COZ74_08835 [Flavobacteriaceae bacterium CG_4_8_14_3_um_filter_31_8]PIY14946.1 MAG: hypothetical protein COZ16_06595 [Flavobacteriaceae bacterium CG_4_10_14_3_um_filter_31_253]PIZ11638.1 MAG: hypotheti